VAPVAARLPDSSHHRRSDDVISAIKCFPCDRRETMDLDPVFLSRLQFAFVIGHAAWLATIEACVWVTGNPVYRRESTITGSASSAAAVQTLDAKHADERGGHNKPRARRLPTRFASWLGVPQDG